MIKDVFPRTWFENYEQIKSAFENGYGYPEFDKLRDEICKCLICDFNMASITLTNHLLEDFLKKMLVYNNTPKNQDTLFGIFDVPTKEYNGINLYDSIEKAYKQSLITEEQKILFHQFRNEFRNPFSHADSEKIFQNQTCGAQELKLDGDKINISDYQKVEILGAPFMHGLAKLEIAKASAMKYFVSVDILIRNVLNKYKIAHVKTSE